MSLKYFFSSHEIITLFPLLRKLLKVCALWETKKSLMSTLFFFPHYKVLFTFVLSKHFTLVALQFMQIFLKEESLGFFVIPIRILSLAHFKHFLTVKLLYQFNNTMAATSGIAMSKIWQTFVLEGSGYATLSPPSDDQVSVSRNISYSFSFYAFYM